MGCATCKPCGDFQPKQKGGPAQKCLFPLRAVVNRQLSGHPSARLPKCHGCYLQGSFPVRGAPSLQSLSLQTLFIISNLLDVSRHVHAAAATAARPARWRPRFAAQAGADGRQPLDDRARSHRPGGAAARRGRRSGHPTRGSDRASQQQRPHRGAAALARLLGCLSHGASSWQVRQGGNGAPGVSWAPGAPLCKVI